MISASRTKGEGRVAAYADRAEVIRAFVSVVGAGCPVQQARVTARAGQADVVGTLVSVVGAACIVEKVWMGTNTETANIVGTFVAVVRANRTVGFEDFGRTDGGTAGAKLGDIAFAGIRAADRCRGFEVRQASTDSVTRIGIVADGR